MRTNIWENYQGEKRNEVEDFCRGYREFISNCKTERECVKYAISEAEKHGFVSLKSKIEKNEKIKPGDKVYSVNMDKGIVLYVAGKKKVEDGLNIIGAHIDSPRLDLKAKPLYESQGFCMIDTHYYGGIKKYQWLAIPLALHGVVVKKDGSKIDFVLGEDEDNAFAITDLLPHLENRDRKPVGGEELNVIAGNIGDPTKDKNKFKGYILDILKKNGVEEEDFFSAEIEVVPAGKAKNLGLDNSMILGYGQDDRVCAYTGMQAVFKVENPEYGVVNLLVDKEEIGSMGATGMQSRFFENCIAEILNMSGQYSELALRRALANSNMLSSDVTAGVDPNFVDPFNVETDAHLARGISFNKFTGSRGKYDANDANPEFIAKLRDCLDKEGIKYQATEMGKVDQGGGGTIAYIMANFGMNVIDAGVPVLNMHAPWEIVSKVDVYETYRCYKAFYGMKVK